MRKVVYLTGAPAAGKSSMTRLLAERVPGLLIWEYGVKLTKYVMGRSAGVADHRDLRTHSAAVVTPEDVAAVDRDLVAFVSWFARSVLRSHARSTGHSRSLPEWLSAVTPHCGVVLSGRLRPYVKNGSWAITRSEQADSGQWGVIGMSFLTAEAE